MGFSILKVAANVFCVGIVLAVCGLAANTASRDSRSSRMFRFPVMLGVMLLVLSGIMAIIGCILLFVTGYFS